MNKQKLLTIAKPILFNTEMVKAILEGRKTVTRRVIKPQIPNFAEVKLFGEKPTPFYIFDGNQTELKPKYCIGDILYVRETWKKYDKMIGTGSECHLESFIGYKANDNTKVPSEFFESNWRPSIHMPKEAARIFLKVTNVRVERLQDITEEEAMQEGIIPNIDSFSNKLDKTSIELFSDLWNSTIKKQDLDEYGWEANPYVWVIEFEKVEVE